MDVKQFKRECILAEHENLSRVVEKELLATAVLRAAALAAYMVAAAVAIAQDFSVMAILITIVPASLGLWLADVWLSYVGVIYKMRRKQLRGWIAGMPAADDATIESWKSPVNPFDVIVGPEKKQALRDAIVSPAGFLPYALIDAGTLLLIIRQLFV